MTLPQKVRRVRLTRSVKKTGKKGRPEGTIRKRRFEETRLGFFLKYETPMEYWLIMKSIPMGEKGVPPAELIEFVGNASLDTSFRKPKFKRYLEEYKEKGVCISYSIQMTQRKARYYEKMNMLKNQVYIRQVKRKSTEPSQSRAFIL